MTGFDIEPHRRAVTDIVVAASNRSLEWYRTGMEVENKRSEGFDPVTAADRAVERQIRDGLAERFPNHAIFGEEFGVTGDGPHRWIIDPIDGTRAFVVGQPMWGTLVGLESHGRAIAGWMHQPVIDETHIATPGAATLVRNGTETPLATAPVTSLAESVLLCTHPEMFTTDALMADFNRVAGACRLTRFSGDCANYGLVASGEAHLVIEAGLAPYDIVPLIPIIEGAGGVITDRRGRSPLEGGFVVAAATAELHAEALALLGPGAEG